MDPYIYAGTNVLKNLRDIRDLKDLAQFEADVTTQRLKELESAPVPGSFESTHLKAIHRYIFQDVYVWAGQFRTVSIAKPGEFYFARPEYVESSLNELFGGRQHEKHIEVLNARAFSVLAGHYLGEISAVHPFREGNGRTQREFIRELGQRNGYVLHWGSISPEQMRQASRLSFERGDNSGMVEIVRAAIDA